MQKVLLFKSQQAVSDEEKESDDHFVRPDLVSSTNEEDLRLSALFAMEGLESGQRKSAEVSDDDDDIEFLARTSEEDDSGSSPHRARGSHGSRFVPAGSAAQQATRKSVVKIRSLDVITLCLFVCF
jgi:hypothetical protein